ncbi:MAG: rhomboid family intramembrane serine protease [Xenococcus sp. MO_188.B8]|nr:rhomboid family intramembrane serine protease [Xenococcus sp. MO_188.B8]
MIPLKDENPISTTPIVVYILIAINLAVFVHQLTLGEQIEDFFQLYAVIPKELTASFEGNPPNQSVPEMVTLVSSQFLHGGWMHIGFNMLYLSIFGNNIEDSLGHSKFLLFYLTCGILASLTHWFFDMQSLIPTLGASGAIAGVMGAYVLKYPKARILTLIPLGIIFTTIRIPAIFFLGFWFLQQAISSFASLGLTNVTEDGIAYWAHSGGFIFGVIIGPMMGLFRDRIK